MPNALAASIILSWPDVMGEYPPHVKPIFFLIISTNSFPCFLRNLPLSERPNTTERLPSLSDSNASPTALSLATDLVDPGLRFSNPTPVTSLDSLLLPIFSCSFFVVLLKVYVLSVLSNILSNLSFDTLLLSTITSVALCISSGESIGNLSVCLSLALSVPCPRARVVLPLPATP